MPGPKKKFHLVVLVGEPLAGKEVVSQYLIKRHKFIGFRFSKLLNSILHILQLPVTRPNQTDLAQALRERFGADIFAKTLLRKIAAAKKTRIVIDGMRLPGDYDGLKKHPGFVLVYVTAPLILRFERNKLRREKVGAHNFTLAEFKREDRMPNEVFIHRLGKKADVALNNDGSLKDLYKQVEKKLVKRYL